MPEKTNENSDHPAGDMAKAMMVNPQALAALQPNEMDSKALALKNYFLLPKPIKRRVRALKQLQAKTIHIEAEFYRELHELDTKYQEKYRELYSKRAAVVSGDAEPNDEDCVWPDSAEEDDEIAANLAEKMNINAVEVKAEDAKENDAGGEPMEGGGSDETKPGDADAPAAVGNGIPDFWLTIFRNCDMLNDLVHENDVTLLKSLLDITLELHDKPMGFTLNFHFASNDYFTNSVLTKKYLMREEPDPETVLEFEGPDITKCIGCAIDWKAGKNLTVRVVKKVQKHKGRNDTRTVKKTVRAESFFNFFNPPLDADQDWSFIEDEELEEQLHADFEAGNFLRERVVPRAVMYFTGDGLDDEDPDEDFEEEEEEECEEEDGAE